MSFDQEFRDAYPNHNDYSWLYFAQLNDRSDAQYDIQWDHEVRLKCGNQTSTAADSL